MDEGRGLWQEGQRAWERLAGWYTDTRPASPTDLDDAERALTVLTDIGLVRRLLDQAEFEAVRTVRRHGRSWAEIATRLGVTRQSAWERWRDLDESGSPEPAGHEVRRDSDIETAASAELSKQARKSRRQSSVVVPNVIGLSWDEAREVLHGHELVALGPDPDGPPLATLSWPEGVVTDQSPESGAKVRPGSVVTLWIERGGGSGVREPRRPKPDPKTAQKMRDEATDEAVG